MSENEKLIKHSVGFGKFRSLTIFVFLNFFGALDLGGKSSVLPSFEIFALLCDFVNFSETVRSWFLLDICDVEISKKTFSF